MFHQTKLIQTINSNDIGFGIGAPIFCLVSVLGPRFFRYASCLFYNPDIEVLHARFPLGLYFFLSLKIWNATRVKLFIINNVKCWVLNISKFKKSSVRSMQGEKRV